MTPEEIRTAALEAVTARAAAVAVELETLDGSADFTAEQRSQWDALTAETANLEARRQDITARAAVRASAANIANTETVGLPTIRVAKTADDAFDLRTLSFASTPGEIAARAVTAIEKMPEVPDYAREAATNLVKRLPELGRRLLLTGSMAYRTAYQKGMVGMSSLWTPEEQHAWRAALAVGAGATGGFAVPFTLDPTIVSTKSISTNPFRRISRVVQTTTEDWNGVTTAGVTASFDAEAAEVSDDSPTLAQPNIPVHMARAFARGSIEIGMDWANIENDLRELFLEAKDDLEGQVFATGTGSGQPTGIVVALTGTASEINAAADDTFAIADVYTIEGALPPKYRLARLDGDTTTSRASWVANHSIYNLIRRFDTSGGAGLWEYLGNGQPARLLGYPAYEASSMDSSVTTSGAVSNLILVIGDFRNYVIVDRIGFNLEFIPHLFATANNLPSGQRGWFGYWRVGADSINDDGFRLLDVPSAA